ncbi:MAG: sulfatase [Candidatus Nanopelagicales bacterium]
MTSTIVPPRARRRARSVVPLGGPGLLVALLVALLAALLVAVPTGTSRADDGSTEAGAPGGDPVAPVEPVRPYRNVVVVMADDMSYDVFNTVPRLKALEQQGTTFTRYAVADSLCCPSRTSFLRGQYLHNHDIAGNVRPEGGWPAYRDYGYDQDDLATWVRRTGVTTGYIGKFLNDYPGDSPRETVPNGWDHWFGPFGTSYKGYGYNVNVDGQIYAYGWQPQDYLTDVMRSDAIRFIEATPDPFFLVVAPFTPHEPATPAKQYKTKYAGMKAPRTPSYDVRDPSWSPRWLSRKPAATKEFKAYMDDLWRKQLRSSESIADLVIGVQESLRATGKDQDTLVVFTSDNGFHLGQHRLGAGKQTVYDEDVVVPLVMMGPGIPAGQKVPALASGVDLAPTIAEALGASVPDFVDGRSLLPLLTDPGRPWRARVLVEHLGYALPGDPDYQTRVMPRPFTSLRTKDYVYAEYLDGSRQLFLTTDTYQLDNRAKRASPAVLARLSRWMSAMSRCSGPVCRSADGGPPSRSAIAGG